MGRRRYDREDRMERQVLLGESVGQN